MAVTVKISTKALNNLADTKYRNKVRFALGNQILADSTKYVPKLEGDLRASGRVVKNGEQVIWSTPYADYQYNLKGKKYHTRGTGGKWDEVASKNHIANWIRIVEKGYVG